MGIIKIDIHIEIQASDDEPQPTEVGPTPEPDPLTTFFARLVAESQREQNPAVWSISPDGTVFKI